MAKTLVVGDIHLKAFDILAKVDDILAEDTDISRVVFLGDVCDEWQSDDDQMIREIEEFVDWVEDRRRNGMQVDVLLGNHDFQYLLGEEGPGTHMNLMTFVRETLFSLDPKIACEADGFLLTHAGLTQWFADEILDNPDDARTAMEQLNNLLADGTYPALKALSSCGFGRGGCEIPGPLWADMDELEEDPVSGLPQIVGHTPVSTVWKADMPGFGHDGTELWFCDTFSLQSNMIPIGDGSMLLIDNGHVSVIHPE